MNGHTEYFFARKNLIGYRCTCLWWFFQPWFLPKNDIWNFKINKISQYWYPKIAKGLNFSNLILLYGLPPLMAIKSRSNYETCSKSVFSLKRDFRKVLISNYQQTSILGLNFFIKCVQRCLWGVLRTKNVIFSTNFYIF